ncbi:MAG: class I SAM-dependent methyltransferase, partial [Candidatus Staskawiczbacteria bacterium]|nr:class I SAM-dependent methyltransferase [Candidatus Staskawiczbacteria bacterium]
MRDTILWKKESDQYFKRSLFSLSDDLVDAEKEVKKLSKIVPNKKEIKSILDLGCNCGVFTGFLTKYFPRADITGIDPSEKAIKFARAKYKKISNLKFIVGGVPGLFFKKKFDLVVVRMVLQWLPRQNLFETMAEIDKLADRLIYINEFSPLVASTSTSIHNKK